MDVRKICIIHLNQIGDLIFSLPLLKALRERFPGSVIHSILRPYLRELLIHSPYVDEVIHRKGGMRHRLRLLAKIRRNRYDLLISLSRSIECLSLTALSGAKMKVGFRNFPWDLGLDLKQKMEGHPSWHNNLKLLKRLNIEPGKNDYVGLLTSPLEKVTLRHEAIFKPRGRYAVISPGTSARRGMKSWEEKKFGGLIVLLKERYDLESILVGNGSEKEVDDRIVEMSQALSHECGTNSVVNLAGKVELKGLCDLLRKASLFVGVDSGIMHLASALDIPVVGIFGPTDPKYVGPQNVRSVVVRKEGMDCVPCYLKRCKDRACLSTLEVERVFEACRQLLDHQG